MLGIARVRLASILMTTATAVAVGCGGGGNTTGSGGSTGTGGTGGRGGDTSTTTTTTTGEGGGGSGSGGAPECMSGEGTVLAGTKLAFGEGNSGQWKKVGFDLDGLVSTAASKDVCQPNSGALTITPYPDGDDGIDNSFGKNLLPQILALYPTWVTDINNGIQSGFFTVLLKMFCLPATGDIPVMVTKLYGGTTLGTKPKFDGTDLWPVAPELLSDPMDPQSSTIVFSKSSVKGDAFDAGKNETFILTVPIATMNSSTSIKLTLYAAHTTMNLSPDRKSATGGVIGGVLNTEEFVAEIKKVGALLGLCDSSLFENLLTQVRQASDIMADGTQDPTKTCDGISMGLNFEMKEVQIGAVGPKTPVGDSCP
jgi:hypothetical protein